MFLLYFILPLCFANLIFQGDMLVDHKSEFTFEIIKNLDHLKGLKDPNQNDKKLIAFLNEVSVKEEFTFPISRKFMKRLMNKYPHIANFELLGEKSLVDVSLEWLSEDQYLRIRNGNFLGKGTFKECHKGTYKGMPVAVSTLLPLTADSMEDFMRELTLQGRMNKSGFTHPISAVRTYQSTDTLIFFTISPLADQDGVKLANISPYFSDIQKESLIYQGKKAVELIHSANIVHLDIKLANFLATQENGTWKLRLTDFGLALPSNHTHLNDRGTTPYFNLPEVAIHIYSRALYKSRKEDKFSIFDNQLYYPNKMTAELQDDFSLRLALLKMTSGQYPPIYFELVQLYQNFPRADYTYDEKVKAVEVFGINSERVESNSSWRPGNLSTHLYNQIKDLGKKNNSKEGKDKAASNISLKKKVLDYFKF